MLHELISNNTSQNSHELNTLCVFQLQEKLVVDTPYMQQKPEQHANS